MLGLTDKVFLPISIFILNVVLGIFKFVLLNAVGACFAIYAKHGCEYASSVGWTRSTGYLETIKSFLNTYNRKNVPGSVKGALVAGFFATLAASHLDKGIASFTNPAFKHGPPRKVVVASPQFAPLAIHNTFIGWTSVVPSNGSVVVTMKKTLNSSIAIPNPADGQIYSPVTSEYSETCTDLEVILEGHPIKSGCATVSIGFSSSTYPGQFIKTQRSPNQWGIVMKPNPGEYIFTSLNTPLLAAFSTQAPNSTDNERAVDCNFMENHRLRRPEDSIEGVTAFPMTSTTKCFHNNGEITTIAMTTTRFINYLNTYSLVLVDSIFTNTSDPLLLAMEETSKTRMSPSPPSRPPRNTSAEVWIELRVVGSTIDIYACGSTLPHSGGMFIRGSFECVYGTISVLHFRPLSKDIFRSYRREKYTQRSFATYMTLEYFTNILGDGKADPISIEKLRNDTVAVVEYMAQLGSNYYADFDTGKLYIQYDVADLKLGLEMPLWVLVVAGIILLVGFCAWQLTEWLVGPPHTSSLYSVLHDQLAFRSNTLVPKLMRFRIQPLMFEDVKLFPDEIGFKYKTGSSCEVVTTPITK
ncbi:hypothetical protein BGX34_005369 [Mortierella sp. NVP85]|nr:hypothetical protein BGX34_005369 [Mortierella sp. NVP85]